MINYYRHTIIGLFKLLNEIKGTPDDIIKSLNIQLTLIKKITYIEKRIAKEKGNIDKIRLDINSTENKLLKIKLSKAINYKRSLIFEYKRIIHIYKSIGDGLAFIYVNKYDIKPLIFKQESGFISGKKGLRKEVEILKSIFDEGRIALLNDITNCLKYGDITVPVDGFPVIIEVKNKKIYSKRNNRQQEGIKKVMEYLITDETENLYNDVGRMKRENLMVEEKNYINKLNTIIEKAFIMGAYTEKIEEGLYCSVVYDEDCDDFLNILKEEIKLPYVFFINAIKYETTGYYPLTLSINSPNNLFDFYAGNMLITIAVDLDYINKTLNRYGLSLTQQDNESYPFLVTWIGESEENYLSFSMHFWGRIAYEFLCLEWFIEEIIEKAKSIRNQANQEGTSPNSGFPFGARSRGNGGRIEG